MRLEVEAEIEDRFFQNTLRAEQKGDQEPAEPAVAVEEGMDGLELDMDEARLDQGRNLRRVGMDEFLQVGHEVGNLAGRRRHEHRVAGAAAADPVLRAPEFAGLPFAAASLRQQFLVNPPDQAQRDRKALPYSREAVIHGRDVVRNVLNVVERHPRQLRPFEQQELGQRRLRALDLGREQCLFPDIHVEEQVGVRQDRGHAIEPAEREIGIIQQAVEPVHADRRRRRQGRRNKRFDPLPDRRQRHLSAKARWSPFG